jgi:hypothetical protein
MLGAFIGIVVSACAMALLFHAVCGIHPEYSLNSHALIRLWQPHLKNGALYLGAFMLLTASIVSAVTVALRRKASVEELVMGTLFFWLLGAISLTFVHPGTTYVFHWPLLLSTIGLALGSAARSQPGDAISWGGWLLLVSAAISALLLWVPFIYMFYLWTAFILLAAIAGLTALALGILIPPLELHRLGHRGAIPGMLLVVGIGFLLAGHLSAHSERPIRWATGWMGIPVRRTGSLALGNSMLGRPPCSREAPACRIQAYFHWHHRRRYWQAPHPPPRFNSPSYP